MRPLRNFVPGLPVHLVHRGHNRERIFHCTGDFLLFRRVLAEAAEEFHVALHGYVLMSNHIHLLLTPKIGEWDISRAMQSAGRRYVGYFNNRYERTGTIWDSRFYSSVIEEERYFLACHRYIDMNPVRAGMAEGPEHYAWSSHRHFALGQRDSILTPHALVLSLGRDDAAREQGYRGLFEKPLPAEDLEHIRTAIRRGRPLRAAVVRRGPGRPPKIDSDTNFQLTRPGTAPRAVAMR